MDYPELLDKEKDIDAVTNSTPDHVHAPAAAHAKQRGKLSSLKFLPPEGILLKTVQLYLPFFLVPRHVLGGIGYVAPSDRLNLAAIGAGGKGARDIRNASVGGRERGMALCDVDFSGSAAKSVKAFPTAKL